MTQQRASGILLHISSLPSPYGIGDLGGEAYRFVEFLQKAGQTYWQILPTNPTSYGDSPYQALSTFAGNPYFINVEELAGEGLLLWEELQQDWGENPAMVDFAIQFEKKTAFSARLMTVLRNMNLQIMPISAKRSGIGWRITVCFGPLRPILGAKAGSSGTMN